MLPRALPRVVLAPLVVLALLLTSCSGADDETSAERRSGGGGAATGTETRGADAPTRIEPAWTATASSFPLGSFGPEATVAGDLRVEREGRGLTATDLTTGGLAWRLTAPRGLAGICFVSPQANPDGLVGVLMEGRGRPCTVAGAVDTRTGRLLWQRTIPGDPPYHEGRDVAVGERTLLATLNCSAVRRFDLRTGRPTGTIAPKDRKCANETATDGTVVAVLSDPVSPATPDDNGTGFIPRVDEPAAFELYDADTGRQLWRRDLPTGRGADVEAVLSSDPLVLSIRERGHLTNRLIGAGGRPGPFVGYEVGEPPLVAGQADGVLVLQYAETGLEVLHGYDTTSGEELWSVDLTAGDVAPRTVNGAVPLVDVTPDGVLLATGTTDEEYAQSTWLTRFDLRDPDEVVTLGTADGPPALLDEGHLVTSDGEGLTGHVVPASGEAGLAGAPPPPASLEQPWEEDDLRPADVRRACAAVTPATLRLLGIARGDLPEPVSCSWNESDRPTYLRRGLQVSVRASQPGTTDDPEAPASEAASAALAETVELAAEDLGEPTAREVTGLGDEARYLTPTDPYASEVTARLLVRWRNVIVDVTAEQLVEISDRRPASVPDHQVDRAALAAAGDVLRALGADVEELLEPPPGRYARAADACRVLAAQLRDLLPGVRPTDLTPRTGNDGATTGCLWQGSGEEAPSFEATVYAVPGSPFGLSADRSAGRFARLAASGERRRIAGLAGTSWVRRYFDRGADYRVSEVVHLQDNLLVSLDYTVPEAAPSRAAMERATTRAARALVAASG